MDWRPGAGTACSLAPASALRVAAARAIVPVDLLSPASVPSAARRGAHSAQAHRGLGVEICRAGERDAGERDTDEL